MNSKTIFNIYCDESCHLLNDHKKVFVIGAIWVEKDKTLQIFKELRELKTKHKLASDFEAKWTKISIAKADYYADLIGYFFKNKNLRFRAVVVPDKGVLNHSAFKQNHDTWYYKMFYVLLNVIVNRNTDKVEYNLYLDIKDTKGNVKVLELKRLLNIASVEQNFSIPKAQQVRSHEVELIQLNDILIGALSYVHRGLHGNEGKKKVIEVIKKNLDKGDILTSSTKEEGKFNILVWKPKKS
ncbi:MAG: DUF3800 domain-containing protein [Patescibacteria group bacterium]